MPESAAFQQNIARTLYGSDGICLTLTHYPAGERQSRHEHDHVQVSFLLAGGIQETIGSRCNEMTVSSACIKPVGADHENLWGRAGALLLTIRLKETNMLMGTSFEPARWAKCAPPKAGLVRAALTMEHEADVDGLVADLLGGLGGTDEQQQSAGGPPWLHQVLEAIWDCETVTAEEAARIGGVHRVHMSRAFAHHVGIPFSLYRQRVMASRAVEAVLRTDTPLAEIALAAGFSDQSHMNRTIAALSGTTPRSLRARLS